MEGQRRGREKQVGGRRWEIDKGVRGRGMDGAGMYVEKCSYVGQDG